MARSRRRVGAAAAWTVLVAIGLMALPLAAATSVPKLGSPSIALTPAAGTPTRSFAVSGQGFSAADTVELFFDKTDVGSGVTDANGKLPSRGLQVPTLAVPGTHWVTALDAAGINAQAPFVVSTPWVQQGYQSSRVGLNPFENLITPLNASQLIKVARELATGPIRSSPAIGSGGVFVGSSDSDLYSFPPTACFAPPCPPTWKLVTGGPVTSSPLVSGASVYVGSADGDVYAVRNNCGTGGATCSPLWTGATGGAVESSPALGTYLYTGSDDGSLYAFKPGGCGLAQCSPVWSVPIGTKVQSSPALAWVTCISPHQTARSMP